MRASLSDRFQAAYTPGARHILELASRLAAEHGWQLYLNGGWVRDALLGIPNADIDVTVVGDAHALAHLLAQETDGEVDVHDRFDTATVKVQSSRLSAQSPQPDDSMPRTPRSAFQIDLVTARRETYAKPGALPTVEASTIRDDLARRDFTINAMGVILTPEGPSQLMDPHGGLVDLETGLVRVLHPRSFMDDPTRLFRAVRFADRLGFHIERGTLELALQAVRDGALYNVSTDRSVRELLKVLEEPQAGKMLTNLEYLGLLGAIHPELQWPYTEDRLKIADDNSITPVQRRNAYLAAIGAEFAQQPLGAAQLAQALNLSAPNAKLVRDAAKLAAIWPQLGEAHLAPSRIYNLLRPLDVKALEAYTRIRALSADTVAWKHLHYYLTTARYIKPILTGNYLQGLGVKPGPDYKRALHALLEARLDGKLNNQADEETFIEAWLRSEGVLGENT